MYACWLEKGNNNVSLAILECRIHAGMHDQDPRLALFIPDSARQAGVTGRDVDTWFFAGGPIPPGCTVAIV